MKKTVVEQVASSFPINIGANSIAVLGATITPLAAFVPFLVQSLASARQAKRLEVMFADLNLLVSEHSEKIRNLSDDQYKILNESISAAFYTTCESKIQFLKNAIQATIENPEIILSNSDGLSRAIRDISADEAKFILENFNYKIIQIDKDLPESKDYKSESIVFRPGSKEEIILSGLISLGLLYTKNSSWDAQMYEWSPLVVRLIILLKSPK